MRVKQPEPFDPNREYNPGIGRQCDKYNRTDRKTIFWRLAYTKTVRTNKKLE